MTVGIVSDTHGYFHPALAEVFADVDLILHAGDLGSLDVLDALEAVAPTKAVWGNIDGWDLRRHVPEHQRLDVGGLDVWMKHIAGRPGRWQDDMGWRLAQDTPDLFICGHSHILRVERVEDLGGMLFINPGAAGRQGLHQEKTCLRLRIEEGTAKEVDVVHLDRDE
jgi:putative phosphoesterase